MVWHSCRDSGGKMENLHKQSSNITTVSMHNENSNTNTVIVLLVMLLKLKVKVKLKNTVNLYGQFELTLMKPIT